MIGNSKKFQPFFAGCFAISEIVQFSAMTAGNGMCVDIGKIHFFLPFGIDFCINCEASVGHTRIYGANLCD